MKNWKDAPHLFANGKFRIKIHSPNRTTYNIEILDGSWLMGEMPDSANLIARPISDMTDEELKNTVEYKQHLTQSREQLLIDLRGGQYAEDFLYLLSIGVYPFDDEEDVIFKPKNEENLV